MQSSSAILYCCGPYHVGESACNGICSTCSWSDTLLSMLSSEGQVKKRMFICLCLDAILGCFAVYWLSFATQLQLTKA